MNIIGAGAYPSMAGITALMAAARMKENRLSIEEREKLRQERELAREAHRMAVCIRQGECPECHSKLIRGKKDKKDDYKRSWFCESCDIVHKL